MSDIEVKVIRDSVSPAGKRITTLQLKYHRFFHSEFMTHRVFSRNASSSRAIPVKKMLSQVWNDPAMPINWGENKPGMQATQEVTSVKKSLGKFLWRTAGKVACVFAWSMMKMGIHKQVSNRILEPWQWIHVVVTATEWDNFISLRDHEMAQPEIHELAKQIRYAMGRSQPVQLEVGDWHLPYVSDQEVEDGIYTNSQENLLKMSSARCARVSYIKHDGTFSTLAEDIALYDRLVKANPPHMSPVEHQALCISDPTERSGNFVGWVQYRKQLEASFSYA